MIQQPKSFSQHQSDILGALSQTGISNLSPGGKARAFMDIIADKCAEIDNRAFANLNDRLVMYATGTSLDILGGIFGVSRIPAQDASISPYDNNLKFFVRTGTFGSINSGKPIQIPANIQVTTPAGNGAVYLLDATKLNADATFQYVSARSYYAATAGNISQNLLTVHNFRNYTDSASGSLLITNEYGITGGRDEEDDENYRYRIQLKLRGQNAVNEAALRLRLLQVPGIQDVVFVPYSGGFYVYLYSISPSVSSEVLSTAQRYINDVIAFPMNGTALSPDLVGFSLSTTIKVRPMTTSAEQADVLNNARSAAAQYIANLRVGEPLFINSVAAAIRAADTRILDVGQANNQIQEIFIWRSRSDGSRFSRYLVSDYVPKTGERLVVETSVPVPINLQVAA